MRGTRASWVLALGLSSPGRAADIPAPTSQLWAGHQRTSEVRQLPILGPVETVSDTYELTRVVDVDGTLTMVEQDCRIEVHGAGGVGIDMDPASVRQIPRPTIQYTPSGAGLVATPWQSGWGALDVDQDAQAGFRVRVRAPLCGGWLDIGSVAFNDATAHRTADGGMAGDVAIRIERDILHASNPCLALLPHHNSEHVSGTFAYVPVPATTTCESLGDHWPLP